MANLEDITLDDLHDALDLVEDKKPTQRLILAILYKKGPSDPMITNWFYFPKPLIYRCFANMESVPLMEAIHDDPPPGRPSKLTDEQRSQFEEALHPPPRDVGFDA